MIRLFLALFLIAQAHAQFDPQLAWQPKKDITQSYRADLMVMMATMFPQSKLAQAQAGPGYQSAVDRQNFTKRLYLLLLLNPPKFRQEKQPLDQARYDSTTQSVSYLMRGRRWKVDVTGMPAEDVLKFMTAGKPISFFRTFASHGAHIDKQGYIIEDKLTGLKTYQTFTHGLRKRHIGINIPLGGYGDPAINNSYLIGADGTPIDPNGRPLKSKIQHGHVYMYVQTFGKYPVPNKPNQDIRSVLLIGIEPAAPGYKSMFKVEHNVASGFKDSTLDPSLTNSLKWRHSGISFQPADYNGMLTSLDINAVLQWENACKKFLSLPTDVQENFMAKWLNAPAQKLADNHDEIMKDIFDAARQQPQTIPVDIRKMPVKNPDWRRTSPSIPSNVLRQDRRASMGTPSA